MEARLTGSTVTSQIHGGPTRNAKDLLPIKLVLDRCPQVRAFFGQHKVNLPWLLVVNIQRDGIVITIPSKSNSFL